jgi:23S rRNA pseudouridine1911/1915/1917 synthase
LQSQFAARSVERVYVALVEGVPPTMEGTLTSRLTENRSLRVRPTSDRRAGREAITRYRVVARRREGTLLELRLVTGRRGQIRAQLAAAGHPIAGDREYGARTDPLRRLALHATRLGFAHPRGGRVVFESPPPPAVRAAARRETRCYHPAGEDDMGNPSGWSAPRWQIWPPPSSARRPISP